MNAPLEQTLFYALIQGITEFIPVSSSAHLHIVSRFFDWIQLSPYLDVATHLGTAFVVIVFFCQMSNVLSGGF